MGFSLLLAATVAVSISRAAPAPAPAATPEPTPIDLTEVPQIADEVLYRGEPLAGDSDEFQLVRGETLPHAIYASRASAVVAVAASDGQGSGSLIHPAGFVLTCAHVVGRDPVVSVVLQDGTSYRARVVASESVADLALLKIERATSEIDAAHAKRTFDWLPIGDLGDVSVGDPVVAIGHPKGFGWTLNDGIVSNLFVFRDGKSDPNIIQTQVPLNPGNSGGPLLDRGGRLIGVVSQGDPGAQSLNWCVSARAVKAFLMRHGDVLPPAQLTIEATPPGSTIFVDGVAIGSAPKASVPIAIGAHVIRVEKKGMGEVSAPIVVLQRPRATMKVRLAPAGTLAVAADTTDVEVYVDGVLRGIAPISIDIAAGSHTVTGVKEGSRESHARALVSAERETEVALSNPAHQAWLSVDSAPRGAEVIIDGEPAGVTPVADREVSPGRHVVDVRHDDAARRVVVDLTDDARRSLEFDLSPDEEPAEAAAAAPVVTPRNAASSPSRARLRTGATISVVGAAVTVLSAAVLLARRDPGTRNAAAVSMAVGSTGLAVGPAIFFEDLWHHGGSAATPQEKAETRAVPGLRATVRF